MEEINSKGNIRNAIGAPSVTERRALYGSALSTVGMTLAQISLDGYDDNTLIEKYASMAGRGRLVRVDVGASH